MRQQSSTPSLPRQYASAKADTSSTGPSCNRTSKVRVRQAELNPFLPFDFKHKLTKQSLCIDSCYNPSWAKSTLHKMETANKAMHSPIAQLPELSLVDAVASLERLPHPPSVENLTCILRKCRKHKNPASSLRLHAYLRKTGLEVHHSLGNYLVPMLVEVGSLCDAQHVFDRLVDRNEYSWTSLITGYIECGDLQHA